MTGLCARVANISIDHFLINQPEFTKKLAKQDSVLVLQRVTGLSFGIQENASRSLRILTILSIKKSINDSDKLSVQVVNVGWGWSFKVSLLSLKKIPVFPEFSRTLDE